MQKVHKWHWKIIYLQYFVLYSLLKAWFLVMSFHSPFFLSTFFILFIVSLDAKIDQNKLVQKKFTLLISKFFMNVFFHFIYCILYSTAKILACK